MNGISRLFLTALCLASALANAKPLKIRSHMAADESGFLVNSHLIYGEKEAILVDAQFIRKEAKAVVDMIKRNGTKLTAVYITHAHPDHYFGLEKIKEAFPDAKIYAHPDVVKQIRDSAESYVDAWKPAYKDGIVDKDKLVYPTEYKDESFTLEGETIKLALLKSPGESAHAVVVYLPTTAEVITGDLIYSQVHLWLKEDKPEGWLKNLEQLKEVGKLKRLYPGHGPAGSDVLIKDNADYISAFIDATKKGTKRADAIAEMTKKYPAFKLPIILKLSVEAKLPE